VAIDGANRHDSKLLAATLDGLAVLRPDPEEGKQHLCLDKGYDHGFVREEAAGRGYEHHIRRCGEGRSEPHPDGKARHWVVERTISWLNRSRRLLVRWEKRAENYLAFPHLACAQLIVARLGCQDKVFAPVLLRRPARATLLYAIERARQALNSGARTRLA
jgi:putative transposase